MREEEKIFRVYMVTNLINGKRYIGKTYDIHWRLKSHFSKARIVAKNNGKLYYFQQAIITHGEENFCIGEIEQCDNENHAYEREAYWIDFYKTNAYKHNKNGYNSDDGGRGGPCANYPNETELEYMSRVRLAPAGTIIRGAPINPDILTIEPIKKEYKFTEEHREKLRSKKIGKPLSAEHKIKVGNAGRGKKKI